MIAIRLPENVAVIQKDHPTQLIEGKCRDVLTCGEYVVIAGTDKTVRVYKDCKLTFTLNLIKKVKKMTINRKTNVVYICDKHGDMWSFLLTAEGVQQITKDSTPIQTNLAIPKCFEYFEIEGQQLLILGDSYCKIKVYNANNIDQLLWIWVPFEGFLKQIIEENDELTMLFKRFDEHENHYFEIYKVKKNELLQETLPLRKIYGDNNIQKQANALYLLPKNEILFQYNYNKIIIEKIEQEGTTQKSEQKGEINDIKITQNGGYIISKKCAANSHLDEKYIIAQDSMIVFHE